MSPRQPRATAQGAADPAVAQPAAPDAAGAAHSQGGWIWLHERSASRVDGAELSLRRMALQLGAAATVIFLIVGAAGSAISRRLAEQQAVHDAAAVTEVLATAMFMPAISDAMLTDAGLARRVLGPLASTAGTGNPKPSGSSDSTVFRVKLWTPTGTIVFCDKNELIGATFALDHEAQTALRLHSTEATISDTQRPENIYERGHGKMLEVYRPVWTPLRRPLLLETYFRYDAVTARSRDLWHAFSWLMISSLGAVLVLMLPIIYALVHRARREQRHREAMARRSLDASAEERRRIAAALHDGVVQQLAAASFTVAANARRAEASGHAESAADLSSASATVRQSIAGLRSLLVDIYPPNLASAGLAASLHDLAGTLAGRGADITVAIEPGLDDRLATESREALFRVAQESLRNAVRHAYAGKIAVKISSNGGEASMCVVDDGVGMIPAAVVASGRDGHFGLRLMADVAARCDARLAIRSAAGAGTTVRMEVQLG
jgi:two-component system NarL family sensor kinase